MESLAGTGTQRPPSGSAGHPFTAVLLDDDGKRASAVSALLSSLAGPDVRLIRMGSPSRPHSMLERILAPVVAAADPARLADNARLIARTIAERQGQEARVVLLIRQAERLQPSVLRSLQAMAPYFAQAGEPTLQVAFIGRQEFQALLDGKDLAPLRRALAVGPEIIGPEIIEPEIGVGPAGNPSATHPSKMPGWETAELQPPSMPTLPSDATLAMAPSTVSRHGRILARGLLAVLIFAAMTAASYVGLHRFFYRDVPARPLVTAAAPAAPTAPSKPAPPPASADDAPTPAPLPMEAPRNAIPERPIDQRASGTNIPAVPELRPGQRANPRIVIHVPAGSAPAEALSARLLRTLGTRPGTVETRRVADTPARPNIRYFHPEDEAAARQVAASMADTGLNWTLRDFSSFQPRPSRGTIELWLPRQP